VLHGQWSLKSFEYAAQTAYRTAPATSRFWPGHRYRVSFAYESERAGQYAWVRGVDGPSGTRIVTTAPLPKRVRPTTFTQRFVAGACGDTWVGLRRLATTRTSTSSP
jgi:endo-alpha-N-acetylgalactosaminidase